MSGRGKAKIEPYPKKARRGEERGKSLKSREALLKKKKRSESSPPEEELGHSVSSLLSELKRRVVFPSLLLTKTDYPPYLPS